MNNKHLANMANLLRRDVLKMTTKAGSGHPTSCMSCAELMSVLFFDEMSYDVKNSENPDNDEFILSKGHAAPILYSSLFHAGCIKNDLMKLRKLNSPLEGHPMPKSLNWIKVATGSLGQGLGVGVGMALAAKLQGRKYKTYVLLGDSEVAEGSIFEALEIAKFYNTDNLIAIIDINRLGQRGETLLGHDTKEYKKRFKGFGWNVSIIDGHNVKQIRNALKKSKNSKRPSIILAKTFKGKGVSFLENKEGFHGKALNELDLERALKEIPNPKIPKLNIKKPSKLRLRKIKPGKFAPKKYLLNEEIATRESYGDALLSLVNKNPETLVLDAEVSNSTFSEKVKKFKPRNFIESFIAEQNMVSMALGLEKKGFNVFASTFSAFFSRAHDQIRMAALSNPKKLTFCGSHAGVSIGEDGASQMGLEDLAIFRNLSKSYVFYPSDAVSARELTSLCSRLNGIKYLRTTRGKTPVIYPDKEKFKPGDFKILKQSKKDKIVIAGAGITLHESLKAHEELKQNGINSAVVDIYSVKPFNHKKFENFLKKHGKKLIVVEDHHSEGGIGEMISESVSGKFKFKHLAIKEIPHSGKSQELLEKYGISSKNIVKEAKKI
ncbi:MAG: transketolase [Candidatus Pacearchaeota archaeon]